MKRMTPFIVAIGITFGATGMYFGINPNAHGPSALVAGVSTKTQTAAAALYAQSFLEASGHMQGLAKWQGHLLIVNFWATWCGPCVEEMPALSTLQKELQPKKIQIIGIGIDTAGNIAQFAAKYKIAYPLYIGGPGATELSRSFGNQSAGLPYTVLINPNGKVVKTYLGKLRIDELRRDLAAMERAMQGQVRL
ncbi:MAG: TlpA disulfide reductase family protein [Burkholderiaceae bacterium]